MVGVIATRITALRQARGLTQGRLGFLAGLTRTALWRIEQDRRPGLQAVVVGRLAVALHTSADYLLGLTDDPTPVPDAPAGPPPPIDWPVDPADLVPLLPLLDRLYRLPPADRQPILDALLALLGPNSPP